MCIATKEHLYEEESGFDIFTFLLRYSFLLNDTTELQNSRDQKTPQLNAPQGNIYMGARYLDPKYSRWISVDPALGEYVPQAPVNDDAKKHNQNLPGMGGVFNSVNLNLFHYAGNNPVRYIDPDGKFDVEILDKKAYITVNYGDDNDFDNAVKAYYGSYKYGTAGNPKVEGIALKGSTSHVFSNDDAINEYYNKLFPSNGWTRDNTESLCTFTGIALGVATGVSIFVCPALTPWLAGALVFNDSINVTCISMDYYENPSKENGAALAFAWIGFVFDGIGLGASTGILNGAVAKSPLFSFCLKSNGRPYYAATGRFMSYNKATMWWITDYTLIPASINFAPSVYEYISEANGE